MIAKEKKSSNIGPPQLRFSGIVYWKFVLNEIAKNDKCWGIHLQKHLQWTVKEKRMIEWQSGEMD